MNSFWLSGEQNSFIEQFIGTGFSQIKVQP